MANHLDHHEKAKEGDKNCSSRQLHSFDEWGRGFLSAMRNIVDRFSVKDDTTKQENRIEGTSVNASWPPDRPTDEESQDTAYDKDKRDASIWEEVSQRRKLTLVNQDVETIIDVVLISRSHRSFDPSVLGRQWVEGQ